MINAPLTDATCVTGARHVRCQKWLANYCCEGVWQRHVPFERQVVHKRGCDLLYESKLSSELERREVRHLLVTGCATDFYVDTTVGTRMNREYEILVVGDGHATADRP